RTLGDLTSQATVPEDLFGRAAFVARSPGIFVGLNVLIDVWFLKGRPGEDWMPGENGASRSRDALRPILKDGTAISPGDHLAWVEGAVRHILLIERTALNFIQRLSGIATITRRFVDAVAGMPVQILDTRKTTPGWRLLEKYAVR